MTRARQRDRRPRTQSSRDRLVAGLDLEDRRLRRGGGARATSAPSDWVQRARAPGARRLDPPRTRSRASRLPLAGVDRPTRHGPRTTPQLGPARGPLTGAELELDRSVPERPRHGARSARVGTPRRRRGSAGARSSSRRPNRNVTVRASPGARSTAISPICVDRFRGRVGAERPRLGDVSPRRAAPRRAHRRPGTARPMRKPVASGRDDGRRRVAHLPAAPDRATRWSVSLTMKTGSITAPGSNTDRSVRAVTSTGRDASRNAA